MLIPLLAAAVRKAEQAAFAMEARGFTGAPRTVFFKPVTVNKNDWVLATSGIMGLLLT